MRIFPLIIVILPTTYIQAEEARALTKKFTVLIKPAKPFAFDKSGAPAGYSIDLWKRVAE